MHSIQRYSLFIIILLVACSCATRKNMLYFQNLDKTEASELMEDAPVTPGVLSISPYDILQIQIKTLDDELNRLFDDRGVSAVRRTTSGSGDLGGYYYWGYLVDDEGYIRLPLIDRIQVSGLTLKEAREKITTLLQEYVPEPYVEVKFLTFKVFLFGEVRSPGLITVPNESSTIIEVLSLAGDLTDYANRKKIKILRGDPTDPEVFIIDLTNTGSFESAGFRLKPNDIVYVEPASRKFLALSARDFSVLLTFVNSLFLIVNIIDLLN